MGWEWSALGVDPARPAGDPSQALLHQQRFEDRRNENLVDVGAKTGVEPIAPEDVVVRRPADTKTVRGFNLYWIEHRRKVRRQHHGSTRHVECPQCICRDSRVACRSTENEWVERIETQRLKHKRREQG